MTYTPEELREAILISVCLGLIIGGCLGFIWAAWMIEAKSTGRIDPRQAASILGKRGRAKQIRTQAEKQEAMTLALMKERATQGMANAQFQNLAAIDRYNDALNQRGVERLADLHAGQGR